MAHLSTDTKTAIIMQAMNRGSRRITDIAASNNIGESTLKRWLKQYKEGQTPNSKDTQDIKPLNQEQKFQHILASNGLNDVELGQYCRQHGLYAHELTTWKNEMMNNKNTGDNAANSRLSFVK